jgi:hypothetical protein
MVFGMSKKFYSMVVGKNLRKQKGYEKRNAGAKLLSVLRRWELGFQTMW